MKYCFMAIVALFLWASCNSNEEKPLSTPMKTAKAAPVVEKKSIHSFKVEDINGETFDFSKLKGKKVLVVNTASKCGLTPQYKELQALYTQYADKGLEIVGFPANNFGSQEPGNNEEIATFCQKNYGVSFPMMSKISVKGADIAPIYQFLTNKSENGVVDAGVTWNFQKFLIDEDGYVVKAISPKVKPNSEEIITWIKQ